MLNLVFKKNTIEPQILTKVILPTTQVYLQSNIIKVESNVDHFLPVLVDMECVYCEIDHLLYEEQSNSIAVI